ncbi:unnamed protein product [Dicrocoelium dendriticum]|nr:unnamed protein product [Dicrocoelium dendriticum]
MRLTQRNKRSLLEKFHRMDYSGDGCLDVHDIRRCIRYSGLPESTAMEFMALFDLDGDGKVTLEEYMAALGLNPPPSSDVRTWKLAFDSIDTDHSGHLSRDEVRNLIYSLGYQRCTEEEIDQWMEENDKNEDGLISFAEFITFMELSTNSKQSA